PRRGPPPPHQLLQVFGKLQQPQEINHRRAIFSGPLADLFRAERELGRQRREGKGCINRIEILALDVLDQADFEQPLVRALPHGDRNLLDPRQLRRAPPPLARYQLIAVADQAYHQRLDDAVRADRLRQLRQALRLEDPPRLHRIRIDGVDWDRLCRRFRDRFGGSWNRLRPRRQQRP